MGAVNGIDRDNIVTSGDGELSIATMVAAAAASLNITVTSLVTSVTRS